MPTVPTLTGPQIATRPIAPGMMEVEVGPGDFGGHIAAGLGAVAQVAQGIRANELARQRGIQARDHGLALRRMAHELGHDPKTGAFTIQGSKAFGVSGRTLEEYDRRVADLTGGIGDPRVRELVDQDNVLLRETLRGELDAHEAAQYGVHGRLVHEESLRWSLEEDGRLRPEDPEHQSRVAGDLAREITRYDQENQVDPLLTGQRIRATQERLAIQGISALVQAKNHVAAGDYLRRVMPALSPEARQALVPLVHAATVRGEGLRGAEEVFAGFPGATPAQLQAEIDRRYANDEETHAEASRNVGRLVRMKATAERADREAAAEAAGDLLTRQDDPLALNEVPLELVMRAGPLAKHLYDLAHREVIAPAFRRESGRLLIEGQTLATSSEGRLALQQLGPIPGRGEAMFSPAEYRARMTEDDYGTLMKLVDVVGKRAKTAADQRLLDQAATITEVVREEMERRGWDGRLDRDNENHGMVVDLHRVATEQIDRQQRATNRVMSGDEVRQLVSGLLVRPDGEERRVEATPPTWLESRMRTLLHTPRPEPSRRAPSGRYAYQDPVVAKRIHSLNDVSKDENQLVFQMLLDKGWSRERHGWNWYREAVRLTDARQRNAGAQPLPPPAAGSVP